MKLASAVHTVNEDQRGYFWRKITEHFGQDLNGRTFGFWGIAFKPETDDMRDAPAVDIIRGLEQRGATVRAYDPQAMTEAVRILPNLEVCENAYEACRGADVLVLVTEWNQFRMLDLGRVKELLNRPAIVDLRNVYKPGPMREAGFSYVSVGR